MKRFAGFVPVALSLVVANPLRALADEAAKPDKEGFVSLFDGKTLKGWTGDKKLWRVAEGAIVGSHDGSLKHNSFLITEEPYENFVLKVRFKLEGGNSGVQFRSKQGEDYRVSGYQADIAPEYMGLLYEEGGRGFLQKPDAEAVKKAGPKPEGWNAYEIRAEGRQVQLFLNGVKVCEYEEKDAKIASKGIVALQIHTGGPMTVRFKDIKIKVLN